MSNRVTITPTKFCNVREGTETFGVRIYDDESQVYDNTWESIPDDDISVLKKVLESDNAEIKAIMSFIKEHENGVNIGGTWYNWDEIDFLF